MAEVLNHQLRMLIKTFFCTAGMDTPENTSILLSPRKAKLPVAATNYYRINKNIILLF